MRGIRGPLFARITHCPLRLPCCSRSDSMAGACGLEKSIFLDALDIEGPTERARFLDQACAGQPELRSSVEALLRAHEGPHELLDTAVPPLTECAGAKIGPYKLLEAIGEGGFGIVFMAQQLEPVRRRVAL